MKRIIIFLISVFLLIGCGPEYRNQEAINEADKANQESSSEKINAKEYKLRLKEFSIEEVMQISTPKDSIIETSDPEYGKRYVTETADYLVGKGILMYYSQRSKYQTYYPFLDLNMPENDINNESVNKCEDFFRQIGISNMKLSGCKKVTVNDIINKINNGEDVMLNKDGTEVNLRENLKDIEILKFDKTIDDISIIDMQKYTLNNDKNILYAYAILLLDDEGISYYTMSYIPEDTIETKDVEIIDKQQVEIIVSEDYNKSVQESPIVIKSIELKYLSEKIELNRMFET